MENLLDFLVHSDPNKPDFAEMATKKGQVREVCIGEGAEEMTEEEHAIVVELRLKYYGDNWHRVVMPILRYNYPNVANLDQFSLASL